MNVKRAPVFALWAVASVAAAQPPEGAWLRYRHEPRLLDGAGAYEGYRETTIVCAPVTTSSRSGPTRRRSAAGDYEERLALAPLSWPVLPRLGLAGALAALPLAATEVTAFHRTVLDAVAEWERQFRPTHSSDVYGGSGRAGGWR